MRRKERLGGLVVLFVVILLSAGADLDARAAEERQLGWSNSTDFNFVTTQGNSETEALGITNLARRRWKHSDLTFKLDAYRADTADDRFALIDPGVTWEPGEAPPSSSFSVVEPGLEPDVARLFTETKYAQKINERLLWNTGLSWDKNEEAGILNRFIAFGALGHRWWEREDHEFTTTYGLSFTDREESEPDPEKDERFAGIRLTSEYKDRFGKVAHYENHFTANADIGDLADYSLDMTNAISVKLSDHLALKVSLLWHYNAEPALEDVDLLARAQLVDPDGVPGNGDEFFQTGVSGGEIEIGEVRLRKDELDTSFRTSLTISF